MSSPFPRSHLGNKAAVEERLKAIASQLIAAHRRKDHSLVIPYARQAGLGVEGQGAHHLFMKAIQIYHPDRLEAVWDRVTRATVANDHAELDGLTKLLELHPDRPLLRPVVFDEDVEEEYGFDADDFGFDIHETEADFGDDGGDEEWDPDAGTFFSAVKRELFGNLDFYPDAADLAKLEGELDLSDYDLNDLDGIEHCVGLTSLNLSRNNIDNVYPLKDLVKLEALDLAENDLEDADWLATLVQLKELDLSANDIDDVAFLDRLPRLRYVDLTGNPVRNRAVLARLEARGVIVIF